MAITRVQQSQISGSLSYSDNSTIGSGLVGQSNLADDLNALRSLIKDIKGEGAWYEAAGQDLKQVYDAMHASGVNADFQGNVSAVGDLSAVNATLSADLSAVNGSFSGDVDAVNADFSGNASVGGTFESTGAATLQAGLTVNGAAADFNADVTANKISIDGDTAQRLYIVDADGSIKDEANLVFDGSKLSVTGGVDASGTVEANEMKIDGDTAQRLYIVGASGEIKDEANLVFDGSELSITGDIAVSGAADLNGALDVAGASDLHGAVHLYDTLEVDGAATFDAGITVTAGGMEIAGDKLELTGSLLVDGNSDLDGTLSVSGAATFNGAADFNAGITVDSVKIDSDVSGRLYIVDTDGSIKDEAKLTFASDLLTVTGDADITGALDVAGASDLHGAVHAYSSMDVDGAASFNSTMDVDGAATLNSTLDVDGAVTLNSTLDVDGNAAFHGNVEVDGDLRVKGSMTYIDTQNMRVQDAFIYLATGSAGASDSGIVLHGGAGAGLDLVIGQDGGAGEVIFGKMDRSPDGDGAMDGIDLVAAWSSALKLGAQEGSLSGSLAADAAGVLLSSADQIKFSANGEDFTLASAGDEAAFVAQFGSVSLVSALVSGASGGNFKQDSFLPGVKAALAAISFSSVGTLRAAAIADDAAKKLAMDVYLNGVRLSYGADYTITSSTEIALEVATMADDRILVAIHNAA